MAPASRLTTLLLPLLIGLLPACTEAFPSPASSSPTETAQSELRYPVTLTDDAQREVEIAAEPQRIVSLAPSNTEIVCALGACDRLVATDDYRVGFPAEVLEVIEPLPTVVTFTEVDLEAIVATEPDIVLAAGNELTPSDDIAALAGLGLPVLVLYPESLDEVYADIELVGTAIDAADEATSLVERMAGRVATVLSAVAEAERPRTFYEVSIFEGTVYTAASDSFLASLIDLAGGETITGDARGVIDLEQLVDADPELILLGDASYDPALDTPDEALAAVTARPGWDGLSAVRDGRVVPFLEDIVTTRPGPRVVDGLEALAGAIHPELFGPSG
jgi:iron complex transport system substrate-binding protein